MTNGFDLLILYEPRMCINYTQFNMKNHFSLPRAHSQYHRNTINCPTNSNWKSMSTWKKICTNKYWLLWNRQQQLWFESNSLLKLKLFCFILLAGSFLMQSVRWTEEEPPGATFSAGDFLFQPNFRLKSNEILKIVELLKQPLGCCFCDRQSFRVDVEMLTGSSSAYRVSAIQKSF